MPTIDQYLNLIPAENRDKPNFISVVTANVSAFERLQEVLASIVQKFDVDLAVGSQLDIVGEWVGVSRNVSIPISGVYFSWDADYTLGWEFGTWQPSNTPASITTLPDDAYRTLIKAKIAANQWDGTTEGAYLIWESIFTSITILIDDNQDMTIAMAFVGGIIDSLTLALITGGYIPLRPEGVLITEYFIPVVSGPMFAWDISNAYFGGWDSGAWAREITP
jgi:Protein of unknown function (DUF2612)